MKKLVLVVWFLLLVILLSSLAAIGLAQEAPETASANLLQKAGASADSLGSPKSAEKLPENLGDQTAIRFAPANLQLSLPLPAASFARSANNDICGQLLANPELTVVEFGDGTGIAEPWVIWDPIVYYSTADYVSPNYSLILQDSDWNMGVADATPFQDAFVQGFFMPDDLTSVRIEYNTATLSTNNADEAHAHIYPLKNGNLDLNNKLVSWTINNSDGQWQGRFVEITDPTDLQMLQGKALGLIIFSTTDNNLPGEQVYFDDITVEACVKSAPPPSSGTVFMPNIFNNFGKPSGPICLPPTEKPQDEYNKNRGIVQTGAECVSTLSATDRADYYAYTPTKTGNHTLRLTNLPKDTEWAAMMFFDTSSPSYVPGPTPPENYCRIAVPGNVDKEVTCKLTKDVPLIVKVSAGSTPLPGPYTMRITSP